MIDLLTAKTPVAIKDKTGNTVPSETEHEFQFELVAGGIRFGTASTAPTLRRSRGGGGGFDELEQHV